MILHELISYDILRVIWWALLGVLLIGFALTDGFDMGVGALLPFVAKTDVERRIAINSVGPVWREIRFGLFSVAVPFLPPGHRFMR